MHGAFEGELPDGWQGGLPTTKYWNGDYIKLYRVYRPCATCSAEISIDVTKKALQGFAKNSGLLLRNCPTCRAARKAGGPGSRGGKSRPTEGPAPTIVTAVTVGNTELEKLRTMNATMKEELNCLYTYKKELEAKLAKYELPAAMATQSATTPQFKPLPAQNGFDPHKALADDLDKKMPWVT